MSVTLLGGCRSSQEVGMDVSVCVALTLYIYH